MKRMRPRGHFFDLPAHVDIKPISNPPKGRLNQHLSPSPLTARRTLKHSAMSQSQVPLLSLGPKSGPIQTYMCFVVAAVNALSVLI